MGLFSTKSSSSSSNSVTQNTTSNIGGTTQYTQDFSELFGKSVISSGSYQEASRQSQTSAPYVSQIPSQSSTTTQRNDSSATSSLGLGSNPLGAVADVASGGLGSALGSALGAGIGSAFNRGSQSSSGYYDYSDYAMQSSAYDSVSSSSSAFLPLVLGGLGVAVAWFLM